MCVCVCAYNVCIMCVYNFYYNHDLQQFLVTIILSTLIQYGVLLAVISDVHTRSSICPCALCRDLREFNLMIKHS